MNPLPDCEICHGLGKYIDRTEEYWGQPVAVIEPCPCLDREEEDDEYVRGAE